MPPWWASLVAQTVKNLPAMQETQVPSLGQDAPLEKVMATYSSILAWRIPWTGEPGRLQSMGSQRAGHNSVTKHSLGGPMTEDWCPCSQKKVSLASAKPLIPDASWTKPGWKHTQREPRGAENAWPVSFLLSFI